MITDILDDIVSMLATSFPECDVVRTYTPEMDDEELATLTKPRMVVVLDDSEIQTVTQSSDPTYRYRLYVSIGVEKKLQSGGVNVSLTTEVDMLVSIVERAYRQFLENTKITAKGRKLVFAQPDHVANRPLVDYELIAEMSRFFGGFQLVCEGFHVAN